MAAPSHNTRPNGPALSSNDDNWDSGYSEVAWTNPACYPTPAMPVGQHWLHHAPHSNSNPEHSNGKDLVLQFLAGRTSRHYELRKYMCTWGRGTIPSSGGHRVCVHD
ncbi:hypothetical protein N7481_008759 [Penicillium waksmanii]|uniref:uncharacterized protein n=1 Tax=Penicillium waksmanii TaxID=69791 RepID=UPI002549BFF4|nr:uncharacterized protein N7481_008759 [Penicillium waksmanii]KAJ5975052.1 hypothetical protein N7481_008759 [Penicillium waksmanii]